jgi:hypothetical protein
MTIKTKVAHTPGPWTYNMTGCESSHGLPIITKANGHLVAELCDHNEANARLIATAPELLEALKLGHRHFIQSNDLTPDDRAVLDELWATILKAKEDQ